MNGSASRNANGRSSAISHWISSSTHYTGLVERTVAFREAAEAGRETDWADQYMRMLMRFETGGDNYCWLNESIFIGEGRLAGPKTIEYRIYRVS